MKNLVESRDYRCIISIKRHREINLGENIIEFRTIGRERFFGFNRVQNAYIASIEKAILDSLYLNIPAFSYVKEAFDLSRQNSMLNLKVLKEYAHRMNSGSVNRKLSKLLYEDDEIRRSEGD